jgi:hypothetical protein
LTTRNSKRWTAVDVAVLYDREVPILVVVVVAVDDRMKNTRDDEATS